MAFLCHYGGIIINDIKNSITYNKGSNMILSASLEMSLVKLIQVICEEIEWNYNDIEVDFTWRMFTKECPVHYVVMLISCYLNLKYMLGLFVQYGSRYIELYLNNQPK